MKNFTGILVLVMMGIVMIVSVASAADEVKDVCIEAHPDHIVIYRTDYCLEHKDWVTKVVLGILNVPSDGKWVNPDLIKEDMQISGEPFVQKKQHEKGFYFRDVADE